MPIDPKKFAEMRAKFFAGFVRVPQDPNRPKTSLDLAYKAAGKVEQGREPILFNSQGPGNKITFTVNMKKCKWR